uniref:C3H1-type domain-containing protein n=1 Tax=Trichuris muris TaxID=70415 RepID=A0A5S6QN78_TRIMR
MFASLGFWQNIPCPYFNSDTPCQRPHCQFSHCEGNADKCESDTSGDNVDVADQDCNPACALAEISEVQKFAVSTETTSQADVALPNVSGPPELLVPSVPTRSVCTRTPLVYNPTPIAELRKRKKLKEERRVGKFTAEGQTKSPLANHAETNSTDSPEDVSGALNNSSVHVNGCFPDGAVGESNVADNMEKCSDTLSSGEDLKDETEEEQMCDQTTTAQSVLPSIADSGENVEEAMNDQGVHGKELGRTSVSTVVLEVTDENPVENDGHIATEDDDGVLHVTNLFGDDSDDDEEFRKAYSSRMSFRKGLAAPLAPRSSAHKVNWEQSAVKSNESNNSGMNGSNRRGQFQTVDLPVKQVVGSPLVPVTVVAPVIRCVEEVSLSADDDVADFQESVVLKKRRVAISKCDKSDDKPRIVFNPKCRIPMSIRQRYLDLFVEECLKHWPIKEEAIEKAVSEEDSLAKLSLSTKGYTVSAVNRLRRLRHGDSAGIATVQTTSGLTHGRTFYESLMPYLLTDEQLRNNGFPLPDEKCPSRAVYALETVAKLYRPMNDLERVCCRCGKTFHLAKDGSYPKRSDECIHHYSKAFKRRGYLEAKYWCCEGDLNSVGCCAASYHVTDMFPDSMLDNYITTGDSPREAVFALDCEMVYTTKGPSLARVTVVDGDLNVVCERTVKPEGELLDCNTRFSDVQKELSQLFGANCILVGHGLENDLRALKMIHQRVVDTSVVFPHRLGAPYKRGLKTLVIEYLKKIIQEDVSGHDSKEDASVCIELMKWKIAQDSW